MNDGEIEWVTSLRNKVNSIVVCLDETLLCVELEYLFIETFCCLFVHQNIGPCRKYEKSEF